MQKIYKRRRLEKKQTLGIARRWKASPLGISFEMSTKEASKVKIEHSQKVDSNSKNPL